jgi:ribosomal protein S18 acetylase RimI-like enzyme
MARDAAIEVREYRPADRNEIMALAPRLLAGMPSWRDRAAWLMAVSGWVASAADAAGDPDHAVFVAVDAGQVLGFVEVTERIHFTGQVDAYVGELVTATGHERRGVARALMRAAEDWGVARGLEMLTLETGAANHAALAFYAANGYEAEDVRLSKQIRTGTGRR